MTKADLSDSPKTEKTAVLCAAAHVPEIRAASQYLLKAGLLSASQIDSFLEASFIFRSELGCRQVVKPLVPEVADSCENHGQTPLVGGGDHLVVTNRTARLDHAGGAGFRGGNHPVGEREERVAT